MAVLSEDEQLYFSELCCIFQRTIRKRIFVGDDTRWIMFKRILYSCGSAVSYRRKLFTAAFSGGFGQLSDIDPAVDFPEYIKVLALDFDGVLAPHGYPEPTGAMKKWLDQADKSGRFSRIYVYSNKPSESRKRYFQENYPEFRFVSNVRKKPYPDGLYKIIELEGVAPECVLMVDDRLLTGTLAAAIAGTSSLYIAKPLADFSYNPVKEAVFATLRFVERWVIFVIGRM
jgi:uncharacterized protein